MKSQNLSWTRIDSDPVKSTGNLSSKQTVSNTQIGTPLTRHPFKTNLKRLFGSHVTLCSSVVVLECVYYCINYIYICPCIVDSSDINQAHTVEVRNLSLADHRHPHIPLLSVGFNRFDSSDKVWSACWCFWTSQMTLQQQQLCLQLLLNLAILIFCTKIATQATCFGSKKATNKKVSEIPKGTSVLLSPFLGGGSHIGNGQELPSMSQFCPPILNIHQQFLNICNTPRAETDNQNQHTQHTTFNVATSERQHFITSGPTPIL